MNELQFNLFQDPDTREVTILTWVRSEGKRIGCYGDVLTLTEESFRTSGLDSIKELDLSFHANPNVTTNALRHNSISREMYLTRHNSIILMPSLDRQEALIDVLHYDTRGDINPSSFGGESVLPLRGTSEEFAETVSMAFAQCQSFCSVQFSLWDASSFFCVFRDDRSGRYYWFDWMKADIPGNQGHAVTAWGYPRVFGQEEFKLLAGRIAVQSLREFPTRMRRDNPNLRPRGSQVKDAGVGDLKRVMVYLGGNPEQAFFRAYNFDSFQRTQEVSGFETGLQLESFDAKFFEVITEAFDHCEVE